MIRQQTWQVSKRRSRRWFADVGIALRFPGLSLDRRHLQTGSIGQNRRAVDLASGEHNPCNTCQLVSQRHATPRSSSEQRIRFTTAVRLTIQRSSTRCRDCKSNCSSVLIDTNRMGGRMSCFGIRFGINWSRSGWSLIVGWDSGDLMSHSTRMGIRGSGRWRPWNGYSASLKSEACAREIVATQFLSTGTFPKPFIPFFKNLSPHCSLILTSSHNGVHSSKSHARSQAHASPHWESYCGTCSLGPVVP